jgi:hypothetical protein
VTQTIFISGPISGYTEHGLAFLSAQEQLKKAGYDVENPCTNRPHSVEEGEPVWRSYMRASVRQMVRCHGVAYLPGWQYSKGAQIEIALAEAMGIPVKSVGEWCYPEAEAVECAR